MLHTDPGFPMVTGEDVTVGHHAILRRCQIGDGSLVGMGATILNGARIGAGCLVGACALITEGKEFLDHSLIVGSPAKVVRSLDSSERLNVHQPTGHEIGRRGKWRIQSVNAAVEAARTTTVQPHASAGGHRDSVEARVEKARSMGASIVTGGSRAQRDGFFYQPTLMVDVNQQNPGLQDEIFGPVVAAVPVDNIDPPGARDGKR